MLGDVTEVYTTLGMDEPTALPSAPELAQLSRKQRSRLRHPRLSMVEKTRHVSQLFIRGDNIIRISAKLQKQAPTTPTESEVQVNEAP